MTKITVDKALIEQAIEALENIAITGPDDDGVVWLNLPGNGTTVKAIIRVGKSGLIASQCATLAGEQLRSTADALRAALAEPAVEPVAVVTDVDEYGPKLGWYGHWAQFPVGTKLYAPATRKPSQMLTEVRAMFVPPPSTAEPAVEPADDNLRESFAQCLTSVYVCGRVWSAWSYGTMTEYDFSLGSECDELLDALVWTHKTIIGLSKAAPQAQKPAEVPLLTDAEISTVTNNQWGIQVTSVMHQAHRAYARAIEKAVRQKAGLV